MDIENLASRLHQVYQEELKRQGKPSKHSDFYFELPENVKNLDRALARYIRTEIIEKLIEDAAKIAPNYTAADGNYGGEGFKQQLIAKWLNKNK